MHLAKRGIPNREQLRHIMGLVLDCDGVLTPSDLYYTQTGQRSLRFHSQDGFGLAMLCRQGVQVAVLSGRPADIAQQRLAELGVSLFIGPCADKAAGFLQICQQFALPTTACAMVGDDVPDIPAMALAGLAIAVGNSHPQLRRWAHWTTVAQGGQGAVREICDALLSARQTKGNPGTS